MTHGEARDLLKLAIDPELRKRHHKHLRGLSRTQMDRLPSLYKTKESKGWDVMVEALVTEESAAGAAAS